MVLSRGGLPVESPGAAGQGIVRQRKAIEKMSIYGALVIDPNSMRKEPTKDTAHLDEYSTKPGLRCHAQPRGNGPILRQDAELRQQ